MLKIDLITGFLGSGKTTFLIEYCRYLKKQGLKLGILEYDFGAINVDMMLVGKLRDENCEAEMIDASGDSDCTERRFRTKLIAMAMSGYDRVVVEPSGVFDMDLFFDIMREEPLDRMAEIGSVITIVNASLEDDMSKQADFCLASQAASSGMIVFSRTQLYPPEVLLKTKEHIARASAEIKCDDYKGKYLEKDFRLLTDDDFNSVANAGYHVNDYVKKVSGLDKQFKSICFLDLPDSVEEIKNKTRKLFASKEYGEVFRAKGFISENGRSVLINATPSEIFESPIGAGHGAFIVIGCNLNKEKITELIQG